MTIFENAILNRYKGIVLLSVFFLSIFAFIGICCPFVPAVAAENDSGVLSRENTEGGWYFKTGKIQVKVSAVTHNIFRITAIPQSGNWPAEQSTFVAPIRSGSFVPKKFDTGDKFGISTDSGALGIINDSAEIYLAGADGVTRLERGRLAREPGGVSCWEASFASSASERDYGIGNPEMNRSGGLVKSFAQTTVGNGVTQVPFIWSTAGYGMLVDFEEKGAEWRRTGGMFSWRVPGEALDLYLLLGDTPYQILDAYTDLTGKPPIPPEWAFGFMMSRWGYNGWEDIRQKWYMFRQKNIPVDAFIYDYDWFEKDWRWNKMNFPAPKENIEEASKMGIKIIGIRKPRAEDQENFNFAKSRNWILPNTKNDLDFSIPEARDWWWQKHTPLRGEGVAGWWNDEAEQEMTEFYYMVKAEHDGMLAQKPDRRVWMINRAFSPGLQRLGGAVWSGDVNSSWEALENQPGTLLNYSLSGMFYCGQDIGGFTGSPSPEMYVRWMQEGVFVPVMRAHGQLNSDRWPWAFGPEAEKAAKEAIELRYRLIPYFYAYAWQASRTGAPLMRPLFFEFPEDPQTFNMEDEWLVGREILAAPVLNAGGKRGIYLPAENWYDFVTGRPVEGPAILSINARLDEIPMYVRAGSILPLGPVIQHTAEKTEIPLDVHVYPGKDADFFLYQDDAETYAYERGQYNETLLQWMNAGRCLLIEPLRRSYDGPGKYSIKDIIVHDVDRPYEVVLGGKKLLKLKDGISAQNGWFYSSANRELKITTGVLNLDRKILVELDAEVNKLLSRNDSKGLTALLDKRRQQGRSAIFWSLAQIGDKEGLAAVKREALKSAYEIDREEAVRAVSAYKEGDLAFFRECLKDPSPPVRIAAIAALQKLEGGADIFISRLNDPDEKVRTASQAVLGILASQGDREAIAALIQILPEENLYGKIMIINALAPRCNQGEVSAGFKKLLQSPDMPVKLAVLRAVKGYCPGEEYFDFIIPLAFDGNESIAMLAREALNSYPEEKLEGYFGQPIKEWKVVGPFDNKKGKGFDEAYPPEKAIDLNAVYPSLGTDVKWKGAAANNDGVVNLLGILGGPKEDVCAYGLTVVESKEERDVQLWMGSDDDIKVWLNGDIVWSKRIGRALKKDEDRVKVRLKKGNNLLLLKICQGTGAWEFTVRLVDPAGKLGEGPQ